MTDSVSRILENIPKAGNPPLHLWNPELSGEIDIVIKADGSWWHESSPIKRQSLVNLFASILRYEPDIGYVLVTPVEKWLLQVEDAPFICIAVDKREDALFFALNIGLEVKLEASSQWLLKQRGEAQIPYINLRDGLQARLNTTVYYELANAAVEHEACLGLWSSGMFFPLEDLPKP